MTRHAWALLVLAGCTLPDPNAQTQVIGPDEGQFADVQPFLERSCGSLDCHGSRYRNLKIYGYYGLRLLPGDIPGGNPTSAAEVAASYDSIVRLEPEIMASVVESGGADPERLTFVRKARGTEQHAGGAVLAVGGNGDTCITTWLANGTNASACNLALAAP
jgi:hypothetical protein